MINLHLFSSIQVSRYLGRVLKLNSEYISEESLLLKACHRYLGHLFKYSAGVLQKALSINIYNNQVAGHTNEVLVKHKNYLLKPSRKEYSKKMLFLRELMLYECFTDNIVASDASRVPHHFIPKYYGIFINTHQSSQDLPAVEELDSLNTTSHDSSNNATYYYFCSRNIDDYKSYISNYIPYNNNDADLLFRRNKTIEHQSIPYIVMQDLAAGFKAPCIIDIKIGTQTYEPSALLDKIEREKNKYHYQNEIGFRIVGFKVYDVITKTFKKIGKRFGRSLLPNKVSEGLLLFFYNGLRYRRDIIISVIIQLERILLWFRSQVANHFYCSSLLIIYEGEMGCDRLLSTQPIHPDHHFLTLHESMDISNSRYDQENHIQMVQDYRQILPLLSTANTYDSCVSNVKVVMIDFAHTVPTGTNPCVDTGYITGITNLLKYLHKSVAIIDDMVGNITDVVTQFKLTSSM